MPGRRKDGLPEHKDWVDDGCEVAPRCLECPLPRCRYDDPGGLRGVLISQRDDRIVAMHRAGFNQQMIAEELEISRRSVSRALASRLTG